MLLRAVLLFCFFPFRSGPPQQWSGGSGSGVCHFRASRNTIIEVALGTCSVAHLISSHMYFTILHHITPYHTILIHMTPYHIISHHIISSVIVVVTVITFIIVIIVIVFISTNQPTNQSFFPATIARCCLPHAWWGTGAI